MKMFVQPPEIYLHHQFVDFRKCINGLAMIVEAELELPVMSGALFIFCNKAKDKLKLLYWDKTGFALWYKRLEKETFKWPNSPHHEVLALTEQQCSAYREEKFCIAQQQQFGKSAEGHSG